jgi:hypothetical protein
MYFAARMASADVVVGIDPYYDYSQIKPPEGNGETTPTIILLKGDGWGDQRIVTLLTDYNDRSKTIPIYAQLVAPDSLAVERMIYATRPLSRDGYMIVLDSAAVDVVNKGMVRLDFGTETILKERGIEKPTPFDWYRTMLRDGSETRLSSQQYEIGMKQGIYPPTRFLRQGEMIVYQKPVTQSTIK